MPTLGDNDALTDCLRSLATQTLDRLEIIVVDNSGIGRVRTGQNRTRVIANHHNVGFGAAINQAFRASNAPYLATLNDDAVADAHWLEALLDDAQARPRAGMWAPEVRLADSGQLDSAGMLIAHDGSSRQRGHGEPPADFVHLRDALLPSGSAALYRRKMLDEIGLFDETFFLYCEDTDLGLRARWAGWECGYVPGAVVEHRYSHSAGRASPLKAYYVERNRLYTVTKNFPLSMLAWGKQATLARYFWHLISLVEGRGKAAEFRLNGYSLAWLPVLAARAQLAALVRFRELRSAHRRIRSTARIDAAEFKRLLSEYFISVRRVASL